MVVSWATPTDVHFSIKYEEILLAWYKSWVILKKKHGFMVAFPRENTCNFIISGSFFEGSFTHEN